MIRRVFARNFLFAVVALMASTPLALGQNALGVSIPGEIQPKASSNRLEPAPIDSATPPMVLDYPGQSELRSAGPAARRSGYLTGNVDFPNFIGFISNPIQSIDPRSVTQLWPMFGSGWVSGNRSFLPSGDMQVYGAGLNVALTDRLSFGLNQGGYAFGRFERDQEILRGRLGLPVREIDRSGTRRGWLNLGGYVQYTLIANVQRQFILTAGMRWEAPCGATQLFQGSGPAYLSPYLTMGKELGNFHVLATTGYEFPADTGDATTNTYYFNLHVDRQFGWLYPLIELNCAHRTSSTDINLTTPRHGVIDLGTFTTIGTSVTAAFGANAVLMPGKLEIGAVYVQPLTNSDRFDYNGMLVKMVYRY